MTRYSVFSRDQIFVKEYGFFTFSKIWKKLFVKILVKT